MSHAPWESGKDIMTEHITMTDLPASERPYEKFEQMGAEALSDAELLAVIIKSGTRDCNSADLARRLLAGKQGNLLNLYAYSLEELQRFPGIGRVKAIQLKAIAELSARIARTARVNQIRMNQADTIAAYYMEQLRHRQTEQLIAAFFDAKCAFLGDQIISLGSISGTFASPREIFRYALLKDAAGLILLHNHPSGDPEPSEDDYSITRRVYETGELIGINLVDHIIIGDNCYYSFRDNLFFANNR